MNERFQLDNLGKGCMIDESDEQSPRNIVVYFKYFLFYNVYVARISVFIRNCMRFTSDELRFNVDNDVRRA